EMRIAKVSGAEPRCPAPSHSPFLFFIVAKLLPPVQRVFPRPSAGSNVDYALRMRVCPQGRFPEERRLRDGPTSQLRQSTLHTRPCAGVRDGSASQVQKGAWRPGIGFQLLLFGNPPRKFLVAVQRVYPAFRQ